MTGSEQPPEKGKPRKRRPRFQRDGNAGDVVLHERDREVLRLLYRHRFMDSEQLWSVLSNQASGRPLSSSTNPRDRFIRRLRRLYDSRYVDRLQRQAYHWFDNSGRYVGSVPFVYALGPEGAKVIAEEKADVSIDRLRWAKKNKEVKWPNIQHQLMVSEVFCALHHSLQSATNYQLGDWLEGRDLYDPFYLDEEGIYVASPTPERIKRERLEKRFVYPDALFSLTTMQDGRELQHVYMLEADRTTMSLSRVAEKVRSYLTWRRLKLHRKTYQGAVQDFVVLFVTPTAKRAESLLRAFEGVEFKTHDELARVRVTAQDRYRGKRELFRQRIWNTPHGSKSVNIFQ